MENEQVTTDEQENNVIESVTQEITTKDSAFQEAKEIKSVTQENSTEEGALQEEAKTNAKKRANVTANAREAWAVKLAAMTPEERKAITAKARATRAANRAKKEAERAAALEAENAACSTTAQEIFSLAEVLKSESAPVENMNDGADGVKRFSHDIKSHDIKPADGQGDAARRVVNVREAARSSVSATEKAANPSKVAAIRAAIGELYDVTDVAAALSTTTRTVLQYIRDGKINAVKVGGSWRVSADALKRFVSGV